MSVELTNMQPYEILAERIPRSGLGDYLHSFIGHGVGLL